MKVQLKPLKGDTFEVEFEPEDTVLEFKNKITAIKSDMPADKQKLILAGKILTDSSQMKEYDIKDTSFIVIMIQKDKPAPAPTPPAPTPTATTEGATIDTQARAESAMPTSAGGFQATIDNIVAMGFPKEDVERCVRAAFGNADRAVEYLMSGIPEPVMAGMTGGTAPPAPAPGQTGPPPTTGTGGTPGLAFPAIPPPSGGGGGDIPPELAQLRSNPQFGQLAQMVNQNPALLQQMLPALAGSYPDIAAAVQQHPEAFMRMLQEAAVNPGTSPAPPMGGPPGGMPNAAALAQLAQNPAMLQQLISEIQQSDPEMAAQIQANPQAFAQMMQQMASGGGGDMPGMGGMGGQGGQGQQVVQLSPEEDAAVQRLCDLGFDRPSAAQAYLACDKNEELAANFLFDQGAGDM